MSDPLARATALQEQGLKHLIDQQWSEAEAACREALQLAEPQLGAAHPDIALLLEQLGTALEGQERLDEAEACARRAVTILDSLASQVDGPEFDRLLIRSLHLLGNILVEQGQLEEAEAVLQRALKHSYAFPAEPGLIANACNSLGILYKRSGRFTEAADLYRRALQLCKSHAGNNHRVIAILCHNLGGVEQAAGNEEDASYWFERARQAGAAAASQAAAEEEGRYPELR